LLLHLQAQGDLPAIKLFFQHEIKFWDKEEHVAFCQDSKIGMFFGQYLYPHCSLDSQRPSYFFTVDTKDILVCMNTVTQIFGLNQLAM